MVWQTLKRWSAAVLLAAQIVVLAPRAPAQTPDLQLRLSSEDRARPPLPALGEFRISLDSQVLAPERGFDLIADEFDVPTFRSPSRGQLVLRSEPWSMADPARPTPRSPSRERQIHNFTSTLTWNAGYLQGAPAPTGTPEPRALGASQRRGRWAVYGEVARQDVPPLPAAAPDTTRIPLPARPLANLVAGDGATRQAGTRPLDPRGAPESASSFLLNNYYLEAIYNFLPTVQGKVSYNRAVAETIDQNQKIQVEGIVEAGKDVVIKAGYRNESVPELKHRRNANDTKVWTEFILKF
ncbi:MAG: hypothetical protein OZSIB_1187 [Candidatus Ozemobacter sibiricus]|uniref:Uncharacterized protein n=1 Tax=Candidatus Ozemobacter sibiricus TaxID=2268124 RepID=A0A367ZKT9_9BACT|nr:MAG: hypothetical protein OZSIB_1187 [Candidatus Ozemobacter sibiricus]